MIKKLIEVSVSATTIRAVIFTIGHFLIDIFVIFTVTGAPIETATMASMVGPVVNGIWFWVIDRIWTEYHKKDDEQHMLKLDTV